MRILLLVASAVLCVSGVSSLVFGIEYKEFSVGSTMIISGVILLSSGFLLVGLAIVAGELRKVANLLDPRGPKPATAARRGRAPAGAPGGFPGYPASDNNPAAASGGQSSRYPGAPETGPVAEADRRDEGGAALRPFTPEPIPEPRMSFDAAWPGPATSGAAPEQGRGEATDAAPAPQARPATPSPAPSQPSPPQPPRRSDLFRRSARASSLTEHPPTDDASKPKAPPAEAPAVTPAPPAAVSILKSGVVDGMAYTLYSDGSIEAELAEGKVRFASIEALRTHLDQR